ncbi:MAG: PH domain-containing protein [archaeon]
MKMENRELSVEYPLDRKKIWKKFLEKLSIVGFLAFWLTGATTIGGLAAGGVWIFLGLIGLVLGLGSIGFLYYWSSEYYRKYYYGLDGNALRVKKGVFFPSSGSIPLGKISDIYSDQDLLDRILGLYDLHFSAASQTSGNLSHIDGLSLGTMENLKRILKSGISGSKGIREAGSSLLPEKTFKPAGSRAFYRQLISAGLGIVFTAVFFFYSLVILFPAAGLVIALLAIPVAIFVTKMELGAISYGVLSDGIKVKRGWITPSESFVFYQNIQDTELKEGFLDRLFDLSTIVVKSMSYESALTTMLPLLSKGDSEEIRKILRKNMRINGGTAKGDAKAEEETAAILSDATRKFKHRFFLDGLLGSAFASGILLAIAILAAVFIGLFRPIRGFDVLYVNLIIFGLWLGLSLTIALFSIIAAAVSEIGVFYGISESGIVTGLNFISRNTKTIRYDKIQDVRINCGTLQSFFGICSVSFETGSKEVYTDKHGQHATSAQGMLESINSISLTDALKLRGEILKRMNVSYPAGKKPLREIAALSGKKPLKKTAAFLAFPAVVFKGIFLLSILSGILEGNWAPVAPASFAFLLFLGAALAVYLYEKEYYRKYWYDENGQVLVVRKGVFGWSEIVVPYRNIQTVYADRDYFDVLFGLHDIWITTVTGVSSNLCHIDGVESGNAEGLARMLADRIEKSRKVGK